MTRETLSSIIKLNMERRELTYRMIEKLIGIPKDVMMDIENGGDSIKKLWTDGGPSPMFYTLVGVLALDTVDIMKLKTILKGMYSPKASITLDTDSATNYTFVYAEDNTMDGMGSGDSRR